MLVSKLSVEESSAVAMPMIMTMTMTTAVGVVFSEMKVLAISNDGNVLCQVQNIEYIMRGDTLAGP